MGVSVTVDLKNKDSPNDGEQAAAWRLGLLDRKAAKDETTAFASSEAMERRQLSRQYGGSACLSYRVVRESAVCVNRCNRKSLWNSCVRGGVRQSGGK